MGSRRDCQAHRISFRSSECDRVPYRTLIYSSVTWRTNVLLKVFQNALRKTRTKHTKIETLSPLSRWRFVAERAKLSYRDLIKKAGSRRRRHLLLLRCTERWRIRVKHPCLDSSKLLRNLGLLKHTSSRLAMDNTTVLHVCAQHDHALCARRCPVLLFVFILIPSKRLRQKNNERFSRFSQRWVWGRMRTSSALQLNFVPALNMDSLSASSFSWNWLIGVHAKARPRTLCLWKDFECTSVLFSD